MQEFFFYVLAFMTLSGALAVLFLNSTVYAGVALVISLLGIAGFYAMLNAHFLAVVQVAVYAGAIMVLIVFVIMLLNPTGYRRPRLYNLGRVLRATVVAGIAVLFIPLLVEVFAKEAGPSDILAVAVSGTAEEIGRALFAKYLVPFETISVLILSALTGAVLIGRQKDDQH